MDYLTDPTKALKALHGYASATVRRVETAASSTIGTMRREAMRHVFGERGAATGALRSTPSSPHRHSPPASPARSRPAEPSAAQLKQAGYRDLAHYRASLASAHRILGQERRVDAFEQGGAVVSSASTRGDRGELNHLQQQALDFEARLAQPQHTYEQAHARQRQVHAGNGVIEGRQQAYTWGQYGRDVMTVAHGEGKGAVAAGRAMVHGLHTLATHPIDTSRALLGAAAEATHEVRQHGLVATAGKAAERVRTGFEHSMNTMEGGGRYVGSVLANTTMALVPGAQVTVAGRTASVGQWASQGLAWTAQRTTAAAAAVASRTPALAPAINLAGRVLSVPGQALRFVGETRPMKVASAAMRRTEQVLGTDVRELAASRSGRPPVHPASTEIAVASPHSSGTAVPGERPPAVRTDVRTDLMDLDPRLQQATTLHRWEPHPRQVTATRFEGFQARFARMMPDEGVVNPGFEQNTAQQVARGSRANLTPHEEAAYARQLGRLPEPALQEIQGTELHVVRPGETYLDKFPDLANDEAFQADPQRFLDAYGMNRYDPATGTNRMAVKEGVLEGAESPVPHEAGHVHYNKMAEKHPTFVQQVEQCFANPDKDFLTPQSALSHEEYYAELARIHANDAPLSEFDLGLVEMGHAPVGTPNRRLLELVDPKGYELIDACLNGRFRF